MNVHSSRPCSLYLLLEPSSFSILNVVLYIITIQDMHGITFGPYTYGIVLITEMSLFQWSLIQYSSTPATERYPYYRDFTIHWFYNKEVPLQLNVLIITDLDHNNPMKIKEMIIGTF